MKTALLFSGQGRYVEDAYKEIKTKILNPYSPDVFCHLWWDDNIKLHGYSGAHRNYSVPQNTPTLIESLYNPKKLLIENPFEFNEQFLIENPNLKYLLHYPSIGHYLSQLNAFQKVSNLLNWEDYDFIIKWRYDVVPLSFPKLDNLNLNKFYPVNDMYGTFNNDNFMFVDACFIMPNFFKEFSKIFDYILQNKLDIRTFQNYSSIENLFVEQIKLLNFSDCLVKLTVDNYKMRIILF